MTPAFSSFSATGTHYIRATAINGGLDVNNVGGWLHQDTTITVTSGSGAPVWSINQPLMSISTATGSDLVAAGGTVDNINITIEGYLNANNDILTGINITQQIVNIQITGGSYVAPDYAAPSRLVGPQGIRAQGRNIQVSGFTSCGRLSRGPNHWTHANIGISNGSVIKSTATVIAAPTQSGNSRCP